MFELLEFGDVGGLDFWILDFLELWIFGYWEMRVCYTLAMYGSIGLCGHTHRRVHQLPASQSASKLPGSWVLAARRNFQAQASKFNITGIQSEATTTAATKWPSSGAWTVAEFSTFELGRPCGPAKPKR